MDRSREARRGSMAAMNGGVLRRRPRSSSLRDSPEEDGAMEMQESGRLRERASKKERDRERSSRSKRRRGDRMMHGSGREEGEETSDESLGEEEEEEEEEEEDAPLPVRHPPPASLQCNSTAIWLSLPPSNHLRKSFPPKDLRPAAAWKADEMIGVPIPRKARSGTGKRSQDFWSSGAAAAATGGDPIHRQPSTSPARPCQATAAPISPSSSNASLKKKNKPIGGGKQQRLPKVAKSSSIQPIEMEVAEVLFGLTRQFEPKQEGHKLEAKEMNGSSIDSKPGVSSPISMAPSMPHSSFNPAPMHVIAPKRKRPRPVKLDDESPASPASSTALSGAPASSGSKPDSEKLVKTEAVSPRPEKVASTVVANGHSPVHPAASQISSVARPAGVQQDLPKPENKLVQDAKPSSAESKGLDRPENNLECVTAAEEAPIASPEAKLDDAKARKLNHAAEGQKEDKFSIDLMAPPPGKLSPEREEFPKSAVDHKMVDSEIKLKIHISLRDEEKMPETKLVADEIFPERRKEKEIYLAHGLDLKAQAAKERSLGLHLDLAKHHKEDTSSGEQQQVHNQQAKLPARMEKPDKAVPVPLPMGGWPSNVPPFGCMGQMPSLPLVVPMDPSSVASKSMQPPNFLSPQPRPKRCATHFYIAQNIHYHQQIAKMNPFWPVAAGMMPYGTKACNLNAVPPTESASILGNQLQGCLPGRSSGAQHDKGLYLSKEKSSSTPQSASANNMLHSPAVIFSLNQQTAGAAVTTNQSAAALKSTAGVSNGPSSSTATSAGAGSAGMGGPSATVSFNYAVPANETQYLAILQNNGYPFPIPAAVGAHPAYRGGASAQAMAFFNGSYYSSQMLHPSQIQQQARAQQSLQNPSTSNGSSSSHKHPQKQLAGGFAGPATAAPAPAELSSQNFPAFKQRQNLLPHQTEAGCEDVQSTADNRALPGARKVVYGQNFTMPVHPQNFALISPAAALGGDASHGEKQQPSHQPTMKVELTPSQAFAMSFASLNGTTASAGVPPGLDFSSMAQNHAILQNLPEAARQGYQITVAAAAATQAAQQLKKSQQILEDTKSSRDAGEEDRKITTGSKAAANVSQQSLNFARQDRSPSVSSILSNSTFDGASRTLSLVPPSANGSGMPHRTSNSGATTSSTATVSANAQGSQQQQQQLQLIQLQKQQQQQQQFQLQHQLASRTKSSASSNNANLYSHPASLNTAKFPQALTGFPQALMQTGSASQSPQWKNSTRSAALAASSSNPVTSSVKTNLSQQQARVSQQSALAQGHQTQTSFGMNSLKMAAPMGQQLAGGSNMPSLSSASTPVVIGSPQNSTASRGSAGSSPRSSTNAKPSPLPVASLPISQQAQSKSSSLTPASNCNMASILGQPQVSPAQNSSTAKQQQNQPHQKQQQQQQPLPQHHIFFSSAYMPSQSSQSSASAAAYYQRHQSQQPQQQQTSVTSSTAMLSLTSSATSVIGAPVTSDPAKTASTASGVKGLHPAIAAFPYIHAMHSVSVKPAEQKQTADTHPLPLRNLQCSSNGRTLVSFHQTPLPPGNDNLNASWQPPDDKR